MAGEVNPLEVARGPEASPKDKLNESNEIYGITEADLRVVVPEIDGTTLVLQRNAKDERIIGAENYGALTPEAAEQAKEQAKQYFLNLFSKLSDEEKKQVEILVVASDATLVTPEEINSSHKRASETAEMVMSGIREAMREAGVEERQLLNESDEFAEFAEVKGPIEFRQLEALKMLSESPEFVEHLKQKYGTVKEFWIEFEKDTDKDVRQEMGAEGVHGIAERMRDFLGLLMEGAKERHQQETGKRLIIWAVSHYDAISPFVKTKILNRPATDYLPINGAAGLTLDISPDGSIKTELSGQEFVMRESDINPTLYRG
jgi:hypothetical protein